MKKLRNWNQWNANDVTVVHQNGFFHITENHLNLRPKNRTAVFISMNFEVKKRNNGSLLLF
jgi:hypothetical protein